MLKKVIAIATTIGIAVLASASMTSFAESFSVISVSTEAEITNADVDNNLSDETSTKVRIGDAGCFYSLS